MPNLLRVVRAATSIEILDFARVDQGYRLIDLYLVERGGVFYVLEHASGGSLSYGIVAKSTSRSTAKVGFDRVVQQRLMNVEEMGSGNPAILVTTNADAKAESKLKIFDHPTWGVNWGGGDEPAPVEEDFAKFLRSQLNQWKGSHSALSVTNHEYWPTFHTMVVEAVRKKYGSKIPLYRGIHGDQAKKILDGSPVGLSLYSSWALHLDSAKAYRSARGEWWVVVKSSFKPEEIALAPVILPDFVEPKILMPLATDVQHQGDELVVGPLRTLQKFSIVLKTRKE